jgi:tripartite-type tricarboxylate transporter receptor subunit TctC
LAAVLSGEASFIFTDVIAGMSYVNAGRLRLLAAATPKRVAKLPNTPTLAESGVPGYDALSWTAIFVPAKTPQTVIKKINADVKEVLKLPDVQEHLVSDASDFGENTPEYAAAYLKKEIAKWGKVIRESGAKAE